MQGVQSNMVMTSVSGHLLGMDFNEQYKKWYSCHPVQLFDLPVVKSCREESMVKIQRTLEREVRGAKLLIIWTDCDREGENIGMEVVSVCRAVSPTLRVLRAKFSEITRTSIERAMRNLVPVDENFVPENFWKLRVTHHVDQCKVDFSWKRDRLFNQRAAQVRSEVKLMSDINTLTD